MLSNRIAQLAPAPRPVPLPAVCSAMLGMTGSIGAGFLIMGLVFVWLPIGDAPPWVFLLVVLFPLLGAVLFALATVQGLRRVTLLRYGEVATARTISRRGTNTTVNDEPVMEYTYEFQGLDGQIYSGSARALGRAEIGDEDEDEEPVLYLASNPRLSTLVDALPLRCTLDVDEAGQWISYESVWPVLWYAFVWAGIVAHMIYGLSRVLGLF